MKQKMIWAYLIHTCQTMWPIGDPESRDNLSRTEKERDRTCEQPTLEWDKFYSTMEFLPSQGFNTLVFDLGNFVRFDSHPEIAMKGSISKDEMKKVIDRCRALGMEPIPKLNFSAGHDPWLKKYSLMVGTEEYYKVCADVIDETAELFGYPSLFHLGLDEETFAMQGGYGVRIVRAPHLWWRDANRLFDRCEHNNMRPWVWSDQYWDHPKEFLENMPKSVLQAPWYYNNFCGYSKDGKMRQKGFQTYFDLIEHGYDIVPTCSTWCGVYNTDVHFQWITGKLKNEHTLGVMTAPWLDCRGDLDLICKQDALRFGIAKRKYIGEE
ncbi:MAG: Tat pathway signal protein [Clostridia bacterium]|nr:Tat pathway signal protein [Clostridia bacterium]